MLLPEREAIIYMSHSYYPKEVEKKWKAGREFSCLKELLFIY